MSPDLVFYGVAALCFGLVVGSFLNVCIYRLPRAESLIYPPSHCPICYQPIRWEDNIPIISWLLLRRRCRTCHEPISFIYPAIELLTGLLFLFYYWRAIGFVETPTRGEVAVYVVHVVFISALLVATVIDFKFLIIPDEISIPGFVILPLLSFVLPEMHPDTRLFASHPHLSSLLSSLMGAGLGAGFIYATGAAGKIALGKEAMGFGDVKLMAMIGAVLGWKLTLFAIVFSAALGTVYGIFVLALTGSRMIPYGPFLSIAAVISLVLRAEVYNFLAGVIQSYRLLFR